MVSDPPYGVAYDPSWRARAGVNLNPGKLGKVTNDDQADWSAAWALFPGDVAYVWHAGKFAATVQASLESWFDGGHSNLVCLTTYDGGLAEFIAMPMQALIAQVADGSLGAHVGMTFHLDEIVEVDRLPLSPVLPDGRNHRASRADDVVSAGRDRR